MIDRNIANGEHYKNYLIKDCHVGQPLDPAMIVEIRGGKMEPMIFTALKKILGAGDRGHKSEKQDIHDAIGALKRQLELYSIRDDSPAKVDTAKYPEGSVVPENFPDNKRG